MSDQQPTDVARTAADVLAVTTKSALEAVEGAQDRLHSLFWKGGQGITFFSVGFVLIVAAVALRIVYPDRLTSAPFLGLIAIAFAIMVMSFVFFLVTIRNVTGFGQSAMSQNEEVIKTLVSMAQQNIEIVKDAQKDAGRLGIPPPKGTD